MDSKPVNYVFWVTEDQFVFWEKELLKRSTIPYLVYSDEQKELMDAGYNNLIFRGCPLATDIPPNYQVIDLRECGLEINKWREKAHEFLCPTSRGK